MLEVDDFVRVYDHSLVSWKSDSFDVPGSIGVKLSDGNGGCIEISSHLTLMEPKQRSSSNPNHIAHIVRIVNEGAGRSVSVGNLSRGTGEFAQFAWEFVLSESSEHDHISP